MTSYFTSYQDMGDQDCQPLDLSVAKHGPTWRVDIERDGQVKTIEVDEAMSEAALTLLLFSQAERRNFLLEEVAETVEVVDEEQPGGIDGGHLEGNDDPDEDGETATRTSLQLIEKTMTELLEGRSIDTEEAPLDLARDLVKDTTKAYPTPPPSTYHSASDGLYDSDETEIVEVVDYEKPEESDDGNLEESDDWKPEESGNDNPEDSDDADEDPETASCTSAQIIEKTMTELLEDNCADIGETVPLDIAREEITETTRPPSAGYEFNESDELYDSDDTQWVIDDSQVEEEWEEEKEGTVENEIVYETAEEAKERKVEEEQNAEQAGSSNSTGKKKKKKGTPSKDTSKADKGKRKTDDNLDIEAELKRRKKSLKPEKEKLKYHKNMARFYPNTENRTAEEQLARQKNTAASWLSRKKAKDLEEELIAERNNLHQEVANRERDIASYATYANFLREILDMENCHWELVFLNAEKESTEKDEFIWAGPLLPKEHPVWVGDTIFGFTHEEADEIVDRYFEASREFKNFPRRNAKKGGTEEAASEEEDDEERKVDNGSMMDESEEETKTKKKKKQQKPRKRKRSVSTETPTEKTSKKQKKE